MVSQAVPDFPSVVETNIRHREERQPVVRETGVGTNRDSSHIPVSGRIQVPVCERAQERIVPYEPDGEANIGMPYSLHESGGHRIQISGQAAILQHRRSVSFRATLVWKSRSNIRLRIPSEARVQCVQGARFEPTVAIQKNEQLSFDAQVMTEDIPRIGFVTDLDFDQPAKTIVFRERFDQGSRVVAAAVV